MMKELERAAGGAKRENQGSKQQVAGGRQKSICRLAGAGWRGNERRATHLHRLWILIPVSRRPVRRRTLPRASRQASRGGVSAASPGRVARTRARSSGHLGARRLRRVATPKHDRASAACLRPPTPAGLPSELASRPQAATALLHPVLSYVWTMLPLLRSFVRWTCQGSCCIFGPLLLPPSP